jgi:hypothetical protein
MPTILVVIIDSVELQLKFLTIKTVLDPLPNFVANPINIPFLTISMLGATIVSTPMVVIPPPSD